MDRKATRALNKNRKRVQRLRKRRKHTQAIELQREVCAAVPREPEEWDLLAEICREASKLEMALAARFEAAKVRRSGSDEWLDLAAEATDWGFENDAIEARFRAADACAVSGDFRRAIELLDQVIEADPRHRQAKRIRRLMASRLPRDDEEEDVAPVAIKKPPPPEATTVEPDAPTQADPIEEPEVEEQSEVSFVPVPAADTDLLIEEATSPHWTPSPSGVGSDDPTPAGYVCNVQPWPTVLDSRTLTFIGATDALGADLEGITETIELAEGVSVYQQGQTGQLLYTLESGAVSFSRERGGHHDLGSVTPGHFFGELGALMGLPSTANARTLEPCLLRVVSRKQVQEQVQASNRVPELIGMLRSWYLETVLHICPLLSEDPGWPEGEGITWLTIRPGHSLYDPAHPGPSPQPLHLIVTGFVRITLPFDDREIPLGFLCPGDICGEIDPSPVSVTAESVVTALRLPRSYLRSFPDEARRAFEERVAFCASALESVRMTIDAERSLTADSEGLTPSAAKPRPKVRPLLSGPIPKPEANKPSADKPSSDKPSGDKG